MKAVQQLFVKTRDWPISCGSAAKMRERLENFSRTPAALLKSRIESVLLFDGHEQLGRMLQKTLGTMKARTFGRQ